MMHIPQAKLGHHMAHLGFKQCLGASCCGIWETSLFLSHEDYVLLHQSMLQLTLHTLCQDMEVELLESTCEHQGPFMIAKLHLQSQIVHFQLEIGLGLITAGPGSLYWDVMCRLVSVSMI